ncbi:MAG: CBS domain-containing protein [Acidimicrobiia bacterium]|nr:CBS domain-containing protein [Acidimicrobiia bacterium]
MNHADELVRTLVTRPAVYVQPDASLRSVAETLAEESIGAVLVRGPHGAEGLVSERDIAMALAEGANPDRTHAVDVMAEELVSVTPTDTVRHAVHLMLECEIRHVPVVEDGVAFAMISARDALKALATED